MIVIGIFLLVLLVVTITLLIELSGWWAATQVLLGRMSRGTALFWARVLTSGLLLAFGGLFIEVLKLF